MSRVIFVRHAQASFFASDYDQLSTLGELQARTLGEHWTRLGVVFNEVVVGPRQRHIKTAEIVGSIYQAKGLPWPEVEVRSDFDEHAVDQLLGEPLEQLLRDHPELAPLAADYRSTTAADQVQRSFQRLFEATCRLWCGDAPSTKAIETWQSFLYRVTSGWQRILECPGRNRTVGVFTSVGCITALLCCVLKCSPLQALELGWRLKNCSLTELVYSGTRQTLDQFNGVPHLTDPGTWTFR